MNQGWSRLIEEHRGAVERFVRDATALDDAAWTRRPAADKWSAGQITEHVVLSYRVANRELQGGIGMRVRTKWWQRLLIRRRYLSTILREGRLPQGARAVREIRLGDTPPPRGAVLAQVGPLARRFEAEIERAGERGGGLTHAIFGKLDAVSALRFMAVHTGAPPAAAGHPAAARRPTGVRGAVKVRTAPGGGGFTRLYELRVAIGVSRV